MKADLRHSLRLAVRTGEMFANVLTNRRKHGEMFQNLVHMNSIRVGSAAYLIGIQADFGQSTADLGDASHWAELAMVVDRIFSTNVDVWVAMQSMDFSTAKLGVLLPYTEDLIRPCYDDDRYSQARNAFVSLESNLRTIQIQSTMELGTKNTFLEAYNEEAPSEVLSRLRRVSTEPLLCSHRSGMDDLDLAEPPAVEMPVMEQTRELKSIGSSQHPDSCTPCSFFCYSSMGCIKGRECPYCHEDHPKRGRRRGRKKRRPRDAEAPGDLEHASIQGDQESLDHDEGDMTIPDASILCQPMPTPTPNSLNPLFTALEVLAPLPTPATPATCQSGTLPPSTSISSVSVPHSGYRPLQLPSPSHSSESSIGQPAHAPGTSGASGRRGNALMTLWYNDSAVVLELGQRKQLLPFINIVGSEEANLTLPITFQVNPKLPQGLELDTSTGVIKGVAAKPTPAGGTVHTVVVTGSGGEVLATASLRIQVLAPTPNDSGPQPQLAQLLPIKW